MIKHLFHRTITRNGKKIKAWYFWYYDENGKQVRKSCGQNGKPCTVKREAEAYIDSLNDKEFTREKDGETYMAQYYTITKDEWSALRSLQK